MPSTSSSTGHAPRQQTPHIAGSTISRAALLRALVQAVSVIVALGVIVGFVVFRLKGADGTVTLPADHLPYFVVGLAATVFAAFFTVWLHGRFLSVQSPVAAGDPARVGTLVAARLQGLLAAAFGVKMFVLVIGFFALRKFALPGGGEGVAKFSQITTFAVTFAGGALLCQLVTALALSRSMRSSAAHPVQPAIDPSTHT
ncbi:MAG: hypothetical protein AB8H80_22280 [Planctomycetota bacterium]